MKANKKICATVIAVAMLSAGSAIAAEKWMIGDFHQHTYFTDGSYPMNDLVSAGNIASSAVTGSARATLYQKGVMPQGFEFGLDFQANSEHGGIRARDGFGRNWNNTSVYPTLPAIGDSTSGQMWRWQSLIPTLAISGYSGPAYMGAFDWIQTIRANYPNKLALTGMEWNPPGHEHSSSGIWAANALPISEFEYRFDNSDSDGTTTTTTASTMGWSGKKVNGYYTVANGYADFSTALGLNLLHNKSLDAVKWMQANYPTSGYITPAHVERAGCGVGAWSIAAFRDLNDNGPSVFFGFEGIPGHEKSSNRGEFSASACGGGTYGGAGYYVATVGGLWDNMLADGRKFFNFASSDFHSDSGADFWPGEYLKTYVKVKDINNDGNYTQDEVLAGLRSGNVYSVHGDLVNDLDYKVIFKTPYGTKTATMGETLPIKKGNKITVQIRFKTPDSNNCLAGTNSSSTYVCQKPAVHHVQLIQGRINPSRAAKLNADGTPNTAFNAIDSSVASVVATFDNDPSSGNPKWTTDAQGYNVITYTVNSVQNDMFFRVRGTNLGYGVNVTRNGSTVYGTDAVGNPLKNTPGLNTADDAWSDLWFYSNPIFVNVTAPTQFIYTSDSHYGISRSTAIANGATAAQPVNQALVATINALPSVALPCDGGVNACATAVNTIDFIANTGDIANRMEGTIQSAAASWAQFNSDYILGLNVKDKNSAKAQLFLTPGNHDVSNAVGFYKAMSLPFDATSYVNIYNLMLGGSLTNPGFIGTSTDYATTAATAASNYAANKVYFSRNIGGVHFIFLGMWPDSAARAWMDSDLASVSSTTPVVLFTHDQPDIETKHLMNPNSTLNHTINSTDKFENLVLGENGGYASATSVSGDSIPEQNALGTWLKNHKNIVAYFHGNSNWNQYYTWNNPNGDVSINTFRVDSPMKGDKSGTTPGLLSYQVISVDPAASQMTVREYRWNTKTWGDFITVSLAPRAK